MAVAEPARASVHLRQSFGSRRWAVATLVVALVAVVVWAERPQPNATPSADATMAAVSGRVVIEGGPPPLPGSSKRVLADSHADVVVTGTTASGARVVRHFTADAQGRFALRLPPGTYRIAALTYSGLPLARQPQQRVTITPGHPVRVSITVQAK
jgi:hypothetical protein